ncbi:hypothetical protein N7490_006601 [Penicillium lividum]|nr:hypothetical protein N7490_006601 [Penicillium lividum]
MSQDTDLASSSFHGSYGLDLFPSDLESSQQTIESTPASKLLHPMISSSLERFGNDWIVYSEISKEDFIFWWLQTIHGNELRERNKSFWDRSRSHSEAWNSFKQVAHTVTGDPKIVCQKCGQLLDHPSRKLNGTTPMARHLRGEKCQRLSNRVAGNSSLQELFARQASLDQGSQLATLIAQVGSNQKPLPRHNNEVENYLESGKSLPGLILK